MSNGSFRQKHPILLGFLILIGIFFLFWGGMTFFLGKLIRPDRADLFSAREGVGVVEVKGMITSAEETIQQLIAFRRDKNIKAILLRIDSPGGTVGASQEIFQEVQRTNEVKPVVASMASLAASGGYYVALGAERIIANPGTLTGSIGVILKFPNLRELFEKIGYQSEVVKSGQLKDIGSPDRALAPEEREMLQNLVDDVHQQFKIAVAASRNLPAEQIEQLADGRIFSGRQAAELGLIDGLGNLSDAAGLAAELAGLQTESPALVYPAQKGFSIWQFLAQEPVNSLLHFLEVLPAPAYEWTFSEH